MSSKAAAFLFGFFSTSAMRETYMIITDPKTANNTGLIIMATVMTSGFLYLTFFFYRKHLRNK